MNRTREERMRKLKEITRKKFILKRFKRSINRNIYKTVVSLNKIANDRNNKNPDTVMEIYNHSVLRIMDRSNKEDKLKKLAISFVLKMNQRDRNDVLAKLEKEAVVEEAEELARDKDAG